MRLKTICLFLFLTSVSLYGKSAYILCIDGGGSKTILQAVDQNGKVASLIRNGVRGDRIEASGSNINTVGVEGVKAALHFLFEGVAIEEENTSLADIVHESRIVMGMAGVALPKNKQIMLSIMEEIGANAERVIIMTDAEMALHLVDGNGIILISGTGSICLGRKDSTIFRVGGLGRVLGDEGSGYQIGLQALKATLAQEYGWGAPTSLTDALKEFFGVSEIKSLIPQVNLGSIPTAKVASCTPLVFDKAQEKDLAAEEIIESAANSLANLLSTTVKNSGLSNCEVHFWGGVFKSQYADTFIQKIMEQGLNSRTNLKPINQSHHNAALLFALKNLLQKTNYTDP